MTGPHRTHGPALSGPAGADAPGREAARTEAPGTQTPQEEAARGAVLPPARRPAVFIDKDGTLVENVPYNVDPARLRFTPQALAGLQRMAGAGFQLVVVTNQPGLATGRFDAAAFERLSQALVARVQAEAGVALAGVYHCPHAPGPSGRPDCACRKPMPGLLQAAAADLRLDLAASWMVGDILDDVEAGRRAGCRSVLLDVGNETLWEYGPLREPQHVAADLLEAAECIVSLQRLAEAPVLLPLPLGEGWGRDEALASAGALHLHIAARCEPAPQSPTATVEPPTASPSSGPGLLARARTAGEGRLARLWLQTDERPTLSLTTDQAAR